jgi:hypothetical protein
MSGLRKIHDQPLAQRRRCPFELFERGVIARRFQLLRCRPGRLQRPRQFGQGAPLFRTGLTHQQGSLDVGLRVGHPIASGGIGNGFFVSQPLFNHQRKDFGGIKRRFFERLAGFPRAMICLSSQQRGPGLAA